MKADDNYKNVTLLIMAIGLLVAGAVALHYHVDKIDLILFTLKKAINDDECPNCVTCSVVSNFGDKNFLKIKMIIPCQDKKQSRNLKKKVSRIKSDFLVNVDHHKMSAWVKQRDFPSIKNELIKIVNRYSDEPIENIYFESFNLF